ncbi:MAG: deoxyribodipyrimidine photo-lyase [Buchnera aphidicola (Schlechtendalia peitan)]
MNTNLVWFRNDLRIRNNLALYYACKDSKSTVLALFISVPEQWKKNFISPRKTYLIYKNVVYLKKELMKLNIFLHYYESTTFIKSINYLVKFCKKNKVNKLYFNYEYEYLEKKRDIIAIQRIKNNFISSYGFHNSTLIQPGLITNQHGKMYKKYNCFKKKCIILLKNFSHTNFMPKKRNTLVKQSDFQISFFNFPIKKIYEQLFPIGEVKILRQLKLFFKKKIYDYDVNHNYFALDNTSMISAHLSIGVLSPLQCFSFFLKYHSNASKCSIEKCHWINELIWREFFKHLLYFYPNLSKQSIFCNWEQNIKWKNNLKYLNAWKHGKTGFPIIDAGMRQLKKLGWMHNRLRMITSSFLVKNLLIDWRKGEKYFMSQLIDGDLALNNGNWKWIASIGSNSMPYFRIFNPILQSKKFDKMGIFIKKYVTELKNIPSNIIHNPDLWNKHIREIIDYPNPIINLIDSKKTVLKIFKHAKKF